MPLLVTFKRLNVKAQRPTAPRQVTRFQHLLAKHQDNHLRAMRKRRTGL